jgi:thiamine-phosphate pyrophosphorylase
VIDLRVVQITARDVLADVDLFARLGRWSALPEEERRGIAVQLRDPGLSSRELLALGQALRHRTRDLGMRLLINDRLDVALAVEADGVHLGRLSMAIADARTMLGSKAIVSVSCHAIEEVARAADEGADAALLSPIFASPGKGAPLGLDALTKARALVGDRLALIALGGVTQQLAAACLDAGAHGVAAIRADLVSC